MQVKRGIDKAVEAIVGELKKMSVDELKKAYKALETEPDMADEFWVPRDKSYLGE